MRIDMHMHSTASDGQYTPTELVRKVKDAGIAIMALTDHDSIGGVEEAAGTAKECGIICIPGIELSIEHENELHMLGYGIDIHDRELKAFCEEMVQERSTRNEKIITFLAGSRCGCYDGRSGRKSRIRCDRKTAFCPCNG